VILLFPSLSPDKSPPFDAAEPLLTAGGRPLRNTLPRQFDALDALWQQFSTAVGAPASVAARPVIDLGRRASKPNPPPPAKP
jgi:hypothetical protein